MKSLTIKNAIRFNIHGQHDLEENRNVIGTITESDPATIIVERTQFDVYRATYKKTINENIFILNNDDELVPYAQYQVANEFLIFYSAQRHLLISIAPGQICKSFFQALQKSYPEEVELQNFDFQISRLIERITNKTSITFSVDDDGVQRKRFSGDAVIDNVEAARAVENGQATFLIGKTDLLQRERTLGFSVSGTLLVYSSLTDIDQTYPFLNVAIATIDNLVDL